MVRGQGSKSWGLWVVGSQGYPRLRERKWSLSRSSLCRSNLCGYVDVDLVCKSSLCGTSLLIYLV